MLQSLPVLLTPAVRADAKIEHNMALTEVINALRRMENKVCDAAAEQMESSLARGSSVSLHVRNAGLDVSKVLNLTKALKHLANAPGAVPISSFSVSYNPGLGDSGTIALAQSLPYTLQEIGFVGCNMGDEGARALLEWARKTSSLRTICIEQNRFSAETRSLYQSYRQSNPGSTVIF